MTKKLTHRTEKQKTLDFGVFDIETHGLGGIHLATAVYDGQEITHYIGRDALEEALLYMLAVPCDKKFRWYAHNGGRYDFLYLLEYLQKLLESGDIVKIDTIPQGDDFIGYICHMADKRKISFADSYACAPVSLKKLSATFAPEYAKKDIGLKRGQVFNPHNKKHMEYLDYDVLGLYHALKKFEQVIWDTFQVNLKWTAGAIAMAAFRVTIPKGHSYYRFRKEVEEQVRKTYHGGLVFIGKSTGNRGHTKSGDIHAAYAGVGMRGLFPVGTPIRTWEYMSNHIGFYEVKFTSPAGCNIAVLPSEDDKGNKRWVLGKEVVTWANSEDIKLALELGYEVEVLQGYYVEECEDVFSKIVDLCEHLEDTYKEARMIAKIIRNSLYGKFGTRAQIKTYLFTTECPDGYTPVINGNSANCEEVPNFYWKYEDVDEDYMLIQWASIITSRVRGYLARIIVETFRRGGDVYTDTDSVKVSPASLFDEMASDGTIPVGTTYGKFTIEYELETFIVSAPKNYIGKVTAEYAAIENDGEYKYQGINHNIERKSKGTPLGELEPDAHYALVEAGQQTELTYLSMRNGKAVLKKSDGQVSDMRKRTFSPILNSTSFEVIDGRFTPRVA